VPTAASPRLYDCAVATVVIAAAAVTAAAAAAAAAAVAAAATVRNPPSFEPGSSCNVLPCRAAAHRRCCRRRRRRRHVLRRLVYVFTGRVRRASVTFEKPPRSHVQLLASDSPPCSVCWRFRLLDTAILRPTDACSSLIVSVYASVLARFVLRSLVLPSFK